MSEARPNHRQLRYNRTDFRIRIEACTQNLQFCLISLYKVFEGAILPRGFAKPVCL